MISVSEIHPVPRPNDSLEDDSLNEMSREDSDVRMLLIIYEVVWDVRSSAVLADPFLPMLSTKVSHGDARSNRKE